MSPKHFKGKIITRDRRDRCINERRNNAPGKGNNLKRSAPNKITSTQNKAEMNRNCLKCHCHGRFLKNSSLISSRQKHRRESFEHSSSGWRTSPLQGWIGSIFSFVRLCGVPLSCWTLPLGGGSGPGQYVNGSPIPLPSACRP